MGMRLTVAAFCAALALAGCGGGISAPNATPEEAARAAYRHNGPASITLYTMVNNRTGSGAHTSMMINAPSQRVVFDPAGSVSFQAAPEINDVLYGITPQLERAYESAHARVTYHVHIQSVTVPPEVAEQALRLAQASGPVSPMACTASTVAILRQLPGFESLRSTLFPTKLSQQFAKLPGVTDRKLFEDDSDNKDIAIAQFEGRPAEPENQ